MDLLAKKAHVRVPENTFLHDDLQYFKCIPFKQVFNQEVVFYNGIENEEYLENLTIDELRNKIKMYNKLFVNNKINMSNAFDIELISCVQKMIKKWKRTDFLEITMTFDTMSKVYSCRVDSLLTSGYKLIKEIQNISKNSQSYENTIKTPSKLKPTKKRLMLTSADKLCHKENPSFFKPNCLNNFLNNDMMFGERAYKQINNMFYNLPYWPEHKNEKTKHSINYSIEDISYIFKEEKLCPQFHQFSAEFDSNIEYDDSNNLENIDITFDRDTFRLKQISIHNLNDNQTLEFMDDDNISYDGVMIQDFSLSQIRSACDENPQKIMENLNKIKFNKEKNTMSELLSMVNTTDISEYTFFDPGRIKHLKCEEHWKKKFNLLTMTSKQKRDYICLLDELNVRTDNKQYKKNVVVQCNTIFKSNILKSINDIATGINHCCFNQWNSNNNLSSSIKLTTCPVRRLDFCEFIYMKPKWLESTDFKIDKEKDSIYLYPNQDAMEAFDTVVLNRGKEYYDANNIDDNVQECDSNRNVLNSDDIQSLKTDEIEINFLSKIIDYVPSYIDMHTLKECLLGTIKPDGNMVSKINLNDIFQQLPTKLPENIHSRLSVALVFVALLHLANEHMLNLENSGDDIIISQGF